MSEACGCGRSTRRTEAADESRVQIFPIRWRCRRKLVWHPTTKVDNILITSILCICMLYDTIMRDLLLEESKVVIEVTRVEKNGSDTRPSLE